MNIEQCKCLRYNAHQTSKDRSSINCPGSNQMPPQGWTYSTWPHKGRCVSCSRILDINRNGIKKHCLPIVQYCHTEKWYEDRGVINKFPAITNLIVSSLC